MPEQPPDPQPPEVPPCERFANRRDGLAILLSCSPKHIDNLDAQGLLPKPVRLGRAKMWPTEEIRQWLAAGAPPRERWEHLKSANKTK